MTISRFGRTSNVTENPPLPKAPSGRVSPCRRRGGLIFTVPHRGRSSDHGRYGSSVRWRKTRGYRGELDLADQNGVGRDTIRRAIQELSPRIG